MIACSLCGSGDVRQYVHTGVHALAVIVIWCEHCDVPCQLGEGACRLCKNVARSKR